MLICALLMRGLVDTIELPYLIDLAGRYWLYFACAVRARSAIMAFDVPARLVPGALAALALSWSLAATGAYAVAGPFAPPFLPAWYVPAGILGAAFIMLLAHVESLPFREGLGRIGRSSMTIFVLHIMVVVGVRIVCVRGLHLQNPYLILPLAVTLGVAVPMVIGHAARHHRLSRVLGL